MWDTGVGCEGVGCEGVGCEGVGCEGVRVWGVRGVGCGEGLCAQYYHPFVMYLQHLEPWMASNDGTERERSSALLLDLLEAYQKQYESSEVSCVSTMWLNVLYDCVSALAWCTLCVQYVGV